MQLTIQEIVTSVIIGLILLDVGGNMKVSVSLFVSWVFVAVGLTFLFADRAFVAFAALVLFVTLVFSHLTEMPGFAFALGSLSFSLFVASYTFRAETWYEKALLTGVWTGLMGGGMSVWIHSPGEGIALCSLSILIPLILCGNNFGKKEPKTNS